MGGLVIDIFIAYLIKAIPQAWHRLGTSKWLVSEAVVDSATSERFWSIPIVTIVYRYEINGEEIYGSDEVIFFKSNSAYDFARQVHPGTRMKIRVDPTDSSKSVLV